MLISAKLSRRSCAINELEDFISGAAQLGRGPTGIAHSKITRVSVLSWPLPVLTSLLHGDTVTKSCHIKGDESLVLVVTEVVSNQFNIGVFRKYW